LRPQNNAAVAAKLRTAGFTVGMWRNRFITGGIAELGGEARSGAYATLIIYAIYL